MNNDLLLHVCCGPCASASVAAFRESGATVTGFFYNPNIQPLLEYRRRLTGAREVADILEMELLTDLSYDPEAWFMRVSGSESCEHGGSRCARCLSMRLERTAQEAAARGCSAFSTTLSISPWQDHDAIQAGGNAAAAVHGVEFVYMDLRSAYPESRRLSGEWGIYRQKYCGCIVSEWERYRAK
jgi:predicted adenine nucleotide alpha hydrolase (AANH) superfamily ATPase